MLDSIIEHLFALLAGDSQLYAGGNAWSDGFRGARNIGAGDEPAQDCVNLYDTPLVVDTDTHRPAVFAGMQGYESDDRLNFPSINSIRTEHRIIDLPLVLVCRGANRRQAIKKRNQLRASVIYILMRHLREDGFWYQLTMPGNRGGNLQQRQFSSATGGGQQGVYEAACVVPLEILYSLSAAGSTA